LRAAVPARHRRIDSKFLTPTSSQSVLPRFHRQEDNDFVANPSARIFKGTRTIRLLVLPPHVDWQFLDQSKQENVKKLQLT
jgi:hypothetical protein